MTARDLLTWLRLAPPATLVPATDVLAALEQGGRDDVPCPVADAPAVLPSSWRERLWVVPTETRLGVVEVAEALGRPRSWVYRRTSAGAEQNGVTPLPCRRLDGELVFVAGDLRAWLNTHEQPVHGPAAPLPTPVTPLHPRGRSARPAPDRRAS